MCSILIAFHLFESVPIIVAANREERFDRPAAPPQIQDGRVRYIAPRDLEAGGTWIGCTEYGRIVALANRFDGPEGEDSRGNLVSELLRTKSTAKVQETVRKQIRSKSYAGFNLLIADPDKAVAYVWDGEFIARDLGHGMHVIVNGGIGLQNAKGAILQARIQAPAYSSESEWRDRAKSVLKAHGNRVCVHESMRGTRSSSVITVATDRTIRYEFANGPPCETSYRPIYEGEL